MPNAIEIKEKGKILKNFVTWGGWEYDSKGWVIEYCNKKYIILTNHGKEYIATKADLEKQIKLYDSLIFQIKEAVQIIDSQDDPL